MLDADLQELVDAARAIEGEFFFARNGFSAASVGAALRTVSGAVHTGVCVDVACGIGFCAEHAAVAEMLKHRECEIDAIVAVSKYGIIPPCGRCRELIALLTPRNAGTRVVLSESRVVPLSELLPEPWFRH